MNLLENKEFLRGLLKQADLINTVNGGSIMATSVVKNTEEGMEIAVTAPSIPVEELKIYLDKGNLTIYSTIKSLIEEGEDDSNQAQIPLFVRNFKIPSVIDINKIEAFYEDGELKVLMPFNDKSNLQRFIPVKDL